MSKIKVNALESSSENVQLSHNGTGIVEIKGAGGADGTLSLATSSGANAVKIKSPPHSAGQSSTLVLPDNQPATGNFLKVKSASGSGNSTVGQLEFIDAPSADLTQLDASNITSGTIPIARFSSSIPATGGAGFKFISKSVVTNSAGVAYIDIDLPDNSARYLIFGKRFCFSNNTSGAVRFVSPTGSFGDFNWLEIESSSETYNYSSYDNKKRMYCGSDEQDFGFIAEMSVENTNSLIRSFKFWARTVMSRNGQNRKGELWVCSENTSFQCSKIRFEADLSTGSYARTLMPNTEILLYQYMES
tara:strand:+ start:1830 stop:2738 length:909 start_codon:yes stop_codon:yes gene_type:complete